VLDTNRRVDSPMIVWLLDEALEALAERWCDTPGGKELLADGRNLLYDLTTMNRFEDFLTIPAYELIP
jgi:hypothetical protein